MAKQVTSKNLSVNARIEQDNHARPYTVWIDGEAVTTPSGRVKRFTWESDALKVANKAEAVESLMIAYMDNQADFPLRSDLERIVEKCEDENLKCMVDSSTYSHNRNAIHCVKIRQSVWVEGVTVNEDGLYRQSNIVISTGLSSPTYHKPNNDF